MLQATQTSDEKEHFTLIGDDEKASVLAVVEHDIQHRPQGLGKLRGKYDRALHARMWKSITHTDEHTRARKMDLVEYSREMERRRKDVCKKCYGRVKEVEIALFLHDWEVAKAALSHRIALDMLCQELYEVERRRGWFGF